MNTKRSKRRAISFTIFVMILVPAFLFFDAEDMLKDFGNALYDILDDVSSYTYINNQYATANVLDSERQPIEQTGEIVPITLPYTNSSPFSPPPDASDDGLLFGNTTDSGNSGDIGSSYTETPLYGQSAPTADDIEDSSQSSDITDSGTGSSGTVSGGAENSSQSDTAQDSATSEKSQFGTGIFQIIPGFGGGGSGGGSSAPSSSTPEPDTTAPDAPVIVEPGDFSVVFNTTTITFVGTAETDSQVKAEYSLGTTTTSVYTTADVSGDWTMNNLDFGQGTTTISLYAIDGSGNISNATVVNVMVDTSPSAPYITEPSNGSAFSTSTITFFGTSTPETLIHNNFDSSTTTADANGDWSITLSSFSEGTTTVAFYAEDSDTLTSENTVIDIYVDTIAPTIDSFSILECSYSLSASKCLAGGSPVHLSFDSSDSDVSFFHIVRDDVIVQTLGSNGTSYEMSLSDGTYNVKIAVYDNLGNSATSTAISIEKTESPLVINEIAWAGTEASAFDEWIEIYNRTGEIITLTNLVIVSGDGAPYITLSGTLSANGYYLLEREASDTTSESEDAISDFGGAELSDTGEVLSLVHVIGSNATTTLDQTPSLSDCGNTWCAGASGAKPRTMERIDSDVSGTDADNWKSNNKYIRNGTDALGNVIYGTPKAENSEDSVGSLPIGFYCPPYTESFTDGGYYTPTATYCRYESSAFSGVRYGALYKGEVASSTQVNSHSMGANSPDDEFGYDFSVFTQGEKYFAVIFEKGSGSANITTFHNFFLSGATPPPSLNYGVIEWYFGAAP